MCRLQVRHEINSWACNFGCTIFYEFFLSWPLVNSIVLRRLVFSGPKNGSIISREQDEKKKTRSNFYFDLFQRLHSSFFFSLSHFPRLFSILLLPLFVLNFVSSSECFVNVKDRWNKQRDEEKKKTAQCKVNERVWIRTNYLLVIWNDSTVSEWR